MALRAANLDEPRTLQGHGTLSVERISYRLMESPEHTWATAHQVEVSPRIWDIPGNGETFDLPLITGIMNPADPSPPTPRLWG